MNTHHNKGLRAVFARSREDGPRAMAHRHDVPCRMRYLDDSRMCREMGHL